SGATGATGATGAKEATKATWAKESTGSTTSTELKSARENSIETNGEQKTEVIDIVRLQNQTQNDELFVPMQDLVFLSPNDPNRRFPIFTNAQKTLIAIGLGLLIL